jgi:integrase
VPKKVRQGGISSAQFHLTLLSLIWRVCRKYPEFGIKKLPNPFPEAERLYTKPKRPALPWSDAQQEGFVTTAPDHLALAYLMLKFCGQRGGDCIAITWLQWGRNETGAWGISLAPEKGSDCEPEFLELPIILVEAIKRAETGKKAATILVNDRGRPWGKANYLSGAIRRHLIKIGLAERGTRTITMHGLRKNAAILAADTDLGTAGIRTLTLHKSDAMAKYYADKRDRSKLRSKVIARINEMEEEKRSAQVQQRRAAIGVVE